MPLPKIALPTFNITLPISKKKYEFRSYLVKEDKVLKMAALDGTPEAIAKATVSIIEACCMEDIKVDNMSSIDVDYVFLTLRSKSVGDVQEVEVTCNADSCGHEFKTEIDFKTMKIVDPFEKDREYKIMLSDKVGVKMKFTDFKALNEIDNDKSETENNITIIYHSIEQIFDEETVYTPKDFTKQEFVEWIEEIDTMHFDKMVEFINTQPTLKIEKEVECPKCKHKHTLVFDDPSDFF